MWLLTLTDEKRGLVSRHKESLHRCQAAPHNLPRVEQQNLQELQEFEKRKRDAVMARDKEIVDCLDAKVSRRPPVSFVSIN